MRSNRITSASEPRWVGRLVLRGLVLLTLCHAQAQAQPRPAPDITHTPESIAQYNQAHADDLKKTVVIDDQDNPYFHTLCQATDRYRCRAVAPGETWAGLFPDPYQREIVMRLNRTNVALRYRRWVILPVGKSMPAYFDLAPVPAQRPGTGKRLVLFDLTRFAFGAYDETGALVYWGPISSGRNDCSADDPCLTVTGQYTIKRQGGVNCRSNKYPLATRGGAPMPYCMHFYRGFAIHGSTLSGFVNRSQGCIRLFYNDAEWLNKFFTRVGSAVLVTRAPLPREEDSNSR